MRVFILQVLMIVGCGSIAMAQKTIAPVRPAKMVKGTARLAGKVVMSSVEDKFSANVYSLAMPDPDSREEGEMLEAIKSQVARTFPHKAASAARKTSVTLPSPVIGINFVADSMPGIPPDNYCAVSEGGQSVNVMNSYFTVHNAFTGTYSMRKTLASISASVGLNNSIGTSNNYRYDPKVVYDPTADRFICVMLNGIDQYNWIVVGFSQSNDPTGGWNFYKFYGDYANDTTWFDYPAISITQNEFFLTGNKVIYDDSWQAGFTRSVVYQFRKQDGYNGDTTLTYQLWDSIQYSGGYLRCLYPLNPSTALLGPSQYFLSNRDFATSNDTTFIVRIPDTIGSTDTTLTVVPVVASTAYSVPPDARQPDTSLSLATNDNRVLGGYIQDSEIQFVCTSIDPSSGASAIYHGVIDNYTTTPSMHAQIFGIDTLDFGYPNISYAGTPGQSIISFNYSGPSTYPGFAAIFSDGYNYSPLTNIHSGDTTIHQQTYQKEQRWGDYSGSQPQWGAPGTVWVEGIFGKKKGYTQGNYGNYMAQITSPNHVGVPVVNKSETTSRLYPNPALALVNFEFTVITQQAFSFFIYDMQGRLVDKVVDSYCQQGLNVIQFNTASLTPGTYLLKAVGSNGESISVHTFVRQ